MPPVISWSRKRPRALREPVAALAADVVAAAVLCDDPGGLEAPLGMNCHRRLELVGPAERGKGIQRSRVLLVS